MGGVDDVQGAVAEGGLAVCAPGGLLRPAVALGVGRTLLHRRASCIAVALEGARNCHIKVCPFILLHISVSCCGEPL